MRYRLYPDVRQTAALGEQCTHARFVWNLALEQTNCHRPGWGPTPGFVAQCRQLTEARAANAWLGAGSAVVQQQALRDFAQAMANFFQGTHRRPTWRKKDVHEGSRVVGVGNGQVRSGRAVARRLRSDARGYRPHPGAMTRSARGTIAAPGTKVRQKAGLNRSILAARWGIFARRLREKCGLAGVVLVEVDPANTSRRCFACGHVAAGRAVAAQGGAAVGAPVNCEPQHVASSAA
jgi:transposase